MKSEHEAKRSAMKAPWAAELSRVYVALVRDRWNLRRAARHAGDPKLKRLLRRLAFRRGGNARELARSPELQALASSPSVDSLSNDLVGTVEGFRSDWGRANEISTVAACIRSNRRLRIAIERALDAGPPDRIRALLGRLRDSAGSEAGTLEARLRDIAVDGFPNTATTAE